MKKTKKMVVVASFAAACTLFAGVGFASAAETPAPGSTPSVSAQASDFDKTQLQSEYNRVLNIANTYPGGNYTQSSWAVMYNDLDTAQAMLNDANDHTTQGAGHQGDVDNQTAILKSYPGKLQPAVAGLPTGADSWKTKDDLLAFYNKVKDVQESSYPGNENWTSFKLSRTSASWIFEPTNHSNVHDITLAYDLLYKATRDLDPSLLPSAPAPAPGQGGSSTPAPAPAPAPVDKKAGLRSAYDKVKNYQQSDFTAASPWAAFTTERDKAKAMLDTDNTQAAFDAEATALNTKAGALISIAGLKADIAKVATLKPADYTEFTWYLVTLDVPYAQSIVNDADATQEDVSTAQSIFDEDLAGLKTPIAGQKTGADVPTTPKTKADLSGLVAQAEKLKQADYTEASWKVFAEALKDAKEALNPDAQSQLLRDSGEDYTYNYVELEDAQSALVRKASPTQGKGGAGGAAAGNKAGLAKTGAAVSIVAGIMALLAAAGAAIKLVDRKRA
ncbi:hypothetical protein OZX67_00470 [Bifidobacterium sp. ESL0728]|uniref:hypothetical protein n=1 Tax=Bifidobacterium sp. ESL0728 TaxID=2983220 RepID=UPI0023F73BF2|nr:hypothetical protein [Bifidobacterium sp. ESL0728]WEV59093.1 hypothetical protein OZX67_00470 [Bifidobacterium sp. ESL0728]